MSARTAAGTQNIYQQKTFQHTCLCATQCDVYARLHCKFPNIADAVRPKGKGVKLAGVELGQCTEHFRNSSEGGISPA